MCCHKLKIEYSWSINFLTLRVVLIKTLAETMFAFSYAQLKWKQIRSFDIGHDVFFTQP